jgi:hypothetical protein
MFAFRPEYIRKPMEVKRIPTLNEIAILLFMIFLFAQDVPEAVLTRTGTK